jgi:hypothetical protein
MPCALDLHQSWRHSCGGLQHCLSLTYHDAAGECHACVAAPALESLPRPPWPSAPVEKGQACDAGAGSGVCVCVGGGACFSMRVVVLSNRATALSCILNKAPSMLWPARQ